MEQLLPAGQADRLAHARPGEHRQLTAGRLLAEPVGQRYVFRGEFGPATVGWLLFDQMARPLRSCEVGSAVQGEGDVDPMGRHEGEQLADELPDHLGSSTWEFALADAEDGHRHQGQGASAVDGGLGSGATHGFQ